MDHLDFISIGNDEMLGLPALGPVVKCWICGEEHPVESGLRVLPDGSTAAAPGELAFFKCGGEVYLCGIGGRAWSQKMKWKVTEVYCKRCGKMIDKFTVPALKDQMVVKEKTCYACIVKSLVKK